MSLNAVNPRAFEFEGFEHNWELIRGPALVFVWSWIGYVRPRAGRTICEELGDVRGATRFD